MRQLTRQPLNDFIFLYDNFTQFVELFVGDVVQGLREGVYHLRCGSAGGPALALRVFIGVVVECIVAAAAGVCETGFFSLRRAGQIW